MNDQLKSELQELQKLEGEGTLDEAQKSRLEILNIAEQAEQTAIKKQKDLDSALAQKDHFRTKAEKSEADRVELETKLNRAAADAGKPPVAVKPLEVEDFINISASLEGLDQREKEYLAEQHKLTGRPLSEIKNGEDFLLWQGGYKTKVEKERALKPSGTQPEGDKPVSFLEKLKNANPAEKEKLLSGAGLYKAPRPRSDRVSIGNNK